MDENRQEGLPTASVWEGWKRAAAVTAGALAAIGLVFRQEVAGAWQVWIVSPTYNHCFLILPIAAYMAWVRRDRIVGTVPEAEWRAVAAVPLLLVFWLGASVLGVLEMRQLIVMTIMQATILAIIGWPSYKRLLAPFLYLYFLVPSGSFLIPVLQEFTSRFAVAGLHLVGIPVFSNGTIIEIPAGTFVVAEACAGLRFLIAAVAFGVFYATEIFASRMRQAIFVMLSFVVPVLANGVRAFGLIAAAEIAGSGAAIEADHITYGWVFFSLVLILLIWLGWIFSDRAWGAPHGNPPSAGNGRSGTDWRMIAAGLACVVLAALAPPAAAALYSSGTDAVMPDRPPPMTGAWRMAAGLPSDWRPLVVRADRTFAERFASGDRTVDRFVAIYRPAGPTSNLIRSDNRIADPEVWHPVSTGQAKAQIDGRPVHVDVAKVAFLRRTRIIWSFYVVNGMPVTGVLSAKLHQARAYLDGNRCLTALVAVSVDQAYDERQSAAELARFLAAMPSLQPYLCRTGERGS